MKPIRMGHKTSHWILNGKEEYPPDTHPFYEYRGYFILRSSPVNSTSYYFEIYTRLEKGEPCGFDFYLNPEAGFRRLSDALTCIDGWLEERNR